MKKKLRTCLWFAIALGALALLIYKTPRDTFITAIKGIDVRLAVVAVVLQLIAQTLLATRWLLLLRANNIAISLWATIRLTYLGLFYNNVMPGGVGGDLLKGWYATHHSRPDQKLTAAVSVFVDRLVGLIGTILMGGLASLFVGPRVAYQGIQIRWLPWGIFVIMAAASIIFFSRRLRRILLLSWLLEKLPFSQTLKRIDEAIRIYRHHLPSMVGVLAFTVTLQGLTIVAVWVLTQALHFDTVRLVHCLMIMPIVWLIGAAIPVPGGVGIIEGCIAYLFCLVINPDNPPQAMGPAAALALVNRVIILYICSLPGVLVPLFGGHLPRADDMLKDMQSENETLTD